MTISSVFKKTIILCVFTIAIVTVTALLVINVHGKEPPRGAATQSHASGESSYQKECRMFWLACDKCHEKLILARSKIRAQCTSEQIGVALADADYAYETLPEIPYKESTGASKKAGEALCNLNLAHFNLLSAGEANQKKREYVSRRLWDLADAEGVFREGGLGMADKYLDDYCKVKP